MKRITIFLSVAILLIAGRVPLSASPSQVPSGMWASAGSMNSARSGAASVLLQDGRILITGGNEANGPTASAEFFTANGSFSLAVPMNVPRSGHTAVVLKNGRVLVAGGTSSGGAVTNTAEIYDPVANTWTDVTGGMVQARTGHTAALLLDGRVLIAGGQNGTLISSTTEIFDPSAGKFVAEGTMSSARTQHAMAVLLDGRVLIVGGNNGTGPVASTDIFDPAAGVVSAGPRLSVARYGHTATTLLNGQVIVIGGNNGNARSSQMDVAPAELFNATAATPGFTTLTSNLATPREGHLAFLLPNNNNVLIVGGTSGGTNVASAELFTSQESTRGIWSYSFGPTGSMATARSSATGAANQISSPASVMQTNGTLLVGGGNSASGNPLSSAEAYGFATVQTDRGDYPPGTPVTITGSGWRPGETVKIRIVGSKLVDTYGPYNATADFSGNFTNHSFATVADDLGVNFILLATGSVSQAQTAFADGYSFTVSGSVIDDVTGTGVAGATLNFYQATSSACRSLTAWSIVSTTTTSAGTYTATGTGNVNTLCVVLTAPANFTPTAAVAGTGSTIVSVSEISTPDGLLNTSSSGNNFLVHKTGAVEVLAASNAIATYSTSAQSIPLTAMITSTDGTVKTGTVTFTILNGTTAIGTAMAGTVSNGIATVKYVLPARTTANSYTIQAAYQTNNGSGGVIDTSHQLTVSPVALTVGGITVNSKPYDGTATATLNTASATLVGLSSGDHLTVNPSGDTANFSDKNVGTGKAVTVTGLGLIGGSNGNVPTKYQFLINDTSNAASTPFPLATQTGDLMVVYAGTQLNTAAFTGVPTFTDGTTMTQCAASACNYTTSNGSLNTRLWTGISPGGTTPTYTNQLTVSGQAIGGVAFELTGVSAVDQIATGQLVGTTSTTITSPTITTSYPNELLMCFATEAKPIANGAHFKGINGAWTGVAFGNQAMAYMIATAAGSYSCTLTRAAGTEDEAITIVSFGGANAANYTLTQPNGLKGNITTKALTVTANNKTKTYGQTVTFAGTEFTNTALVNPDTLTSVTLTSAGAAATATAAGSPYSIVPSAAVGTGLGNYAIGYVNGTMTVTKIATTVTVTGGTFAYSGTAHAATATAVAADGVTPVSGTFAFIYTPSGTSTAPTAPGTYSVTANFTSSNSNYANSTGTGSITITPAGTLTYTANSSTRSYGATNPMFTGTVTGFTGSDTQANSTTGTMTFTSPATISSAVGSYPINGSGLTSNNGKYSFVQAAANAAALTIAQATPIIKVTGGTFTYTGNQYSATATAVGADGVTPVNGAFTFLYTPSGTSAAPSAVGTYTVAATFTSSDPNYTNATGSASISISPSATNNVTFNNANTVVAAFGTSSLNTPMNVAPGGSNTVAFATVWVDEASGPSGTTFNVTATYGGQAMTSAGVTSYDYDYAPISAQVFYLVNPPTGANPLVVNATASSGTIEEVVANLVSYNGVNQTTPVRPGTYQILNSAASGTVGSFTATLASNANDLTLGAVEQTYHFATPASNQTVDGTASADFAVGSDHGTASAPSVNDTWSFTNPYAFFAYAGFSIEAAN